MRLKQTCTPSILGAVRCQSLEQSVHQLRAFDLLKKPAAAARPSKATLHLRALKCVLLGVSSVRPTVKHGTDVCSLL